MDFVCAQSLLDDFGLGEVMRAAKEVQKAVEQEQYDTATELWGVTENVVEQVRDVKTFTNTGCVTILCYITIY